MIGSSGSAPHSSNHRQPISYARRLRRLKTMRTRSNAQHGKVDKRQKAEGKTRKTKHETQKLKDEHRRPNHIQKCRSKSSVDDRIRGSPSDQWPAISDDAD